MFSSHLEDPAARVDKVVTSSYLAHHYCALRMPCTIPPIVDSITSGVNEAIGSRSCHDSSAKSGIRVRGDEGAPGGDSKTNGVGELTDVVPLDVPEGGGVVRLIFDHEDLRKSRLGC